MTDNLLVVSLFYAEAPIPHPTRCRLHAGCWAATTRDTKQAPTGGWLASESASQAWMASAGGRLWRSPRGQSSVTRRKAWGRDDFADSIDAQVDDPSAGGCNGGSKKNYGGRHDLGAAIPDMPREPRPVGCVFDVARFRNPGRQPARRDGDRPVGG